MENISTTQPQTNSNPAMEKPANFIDLDSKEIREKAKPVNYLPNKKLTIFLFALLFITSGFGIFITKHQANKARESVKPRNLLIPTSPPMNDNLPTKNTEGWKTYKNPDWGIEFLYRPDLKVDENLSKNQILLSNSEGSPDYNYETSFQAQLTVIDLNNLSIKEYAVVTPCKQWVDLTETYTTCKDGVQKSLQDYNSNEIKGVKFKFMGDIVKIIFSNSDKSQNFELSSWSEEGSGGPTKLGLATIDQILSTFKFTDRSADSISEGQINAKPTGWDTPAAGICANVIPGETIVVTREVDFIFSPRCSKALPNQRLTIINNSNLPINIDIGKYKIDINPNESYTFPEILGSFLGSGVHQIGGTEIWMQQ